MPGRGANTVILFLVSSTSDLCKLVVKFKKSKECLHMQKSNDVGFF